MAYTNYQGLPPQTSLADELSKLISDPRTQNAISSITLRDGTTVQLNPERHQCPTCKTLFADKKSHGDDHKHCFVVCAVHEQYATGGWYSGAEPALNHATNPAFSHTCCFVSRCNSRYRIANGWSNLDIIQHVIMDHTHLNDRAKQEMLVGTRRR